MHTVAELQVLKTSLKACQKMAKIVPDAFRKAYTGDFLLAGGCRLLFPESVAPRHAPWRGRAGGGGGGRRKRRCWRAGRGQLSDDGRPLNVARLRTERRFAANAPQRTL